MNKEEDEKWKMVREYIMQCPLVPRDHPAIQAAVRGLDQEQQRRDRDEKLRQKFSNTLTNSCKQPESKEDNDGGRGDDDEDDEMIADDWLPVAADVVAPTDPDGSLSSHVIQAISENGILVSTPAAALAAVLHAATLLLMPSWECTGVPETVPKGGFAPPIRAISTWLPVNWDKNHPISLRYRSKSTLESAIITVQQEEPYKIRLVWMRNQEPSWTLDVEDYWNWESWNRACLNSTLPRSPSLHYKGLSTLLALFRKQIAESTAASIQVEETQAYPTLVNSTASWKATSTDPTTAFDTKDDQGRGYPIPTRLETAFPGLSGIPGQFRGDLFPGGGDGGGNLMGPNHAFFTGGHGDSGGFLQPRFDPYNPPLPDVGGGLRPLRPNNGVPNPDHLRPPNNLNNNMFL